MTQELPWFSHTFSWLRWSLDCAGRKIYRLWRRYISTTSIVRSDHGLVYWINSQTHPVLPTWPHVRRPCGMVHLCSRVNQQFYKVSKPSFEHVQSKELEPRFSNLFFVCLYLSYKARYPPSKFIFSGQSELCIPSKPPPQTMAMKTQQYGNYSVWYVRKGGLNSLHTANIGAW